MNNKWLKWATELQSIAQSGITFCENDYDRDRYEKIRDITVDILHEYTQLDHKKVRDLFASEKGYQTPKVDVRGVVFRKDKILLIKEKIDGGWAMPGGWADVNTSVSESVIRECQEEAGAIVKPKRIIAIHQASKHNNPVYPFTIYKIFVECDLVDYTFKDNTETLDSGFFSINSLPVLSTDRTSKSQIEICFEAKKHKLFETIFD